MFSAESVTVQAPGACGSCHLNLPPSSVLAFRRAPEQVAACPHCGCLLAAASPLREAEATARLLYAPANKRTDSQLSALRRPRRTLVKTGAPP
jgi:C4-type zinc ribbon domain